MTNGEIKVLENGTIESNGGHFVAKPYSGAAKQFVSYEFAAAYLARH